MKAVWALADLHLSFGVPNKKMDIFGKQWERHADKLGAHWHATVGKDDLVLIAGDISWAMRSDEAVSDLQWIEELPGTKVILRGNHDYWWTSLGKVQQILPPSIHVIQNNAYQWDDISIGGARLWDTSEYRFHEIIEFVPGSKSIEELEHDKESDLANTEKIFRRELQRLEVSLKELNQQAKFRIAMTHYPPIGLDLKPSQASLLLEKYRVDICVFGHLHSVKKGLTLFGEKNGVRYVLTSCDYLDFAPIKLL
jgi:predicted phosphohydrolase